MWKAIKRDSLFCQYVNSPLNANYYYNFYLDTLFNYTKFGKIFTR